MEAIQYTCCRCGYLSSSKKLMRRHLYERKVVCPTKFDIELTDEIKEHILTYRIYHVPRHDVPVVPVVPVRRIVTNINRTVTNNNNNNNTTINIIADIDFLKKQQNYALHKNLIISSIDDMTGETFADNIKRSDIIATQEKVACIIQGNSMKNIVKLNSSIVTIVGMDEAFKTRIMNQFLYTHLV